MSDQARNRRSVSRRGLLAAGVAGGGLLLIPSRAAAQPAVEAAAEEPYHVVDPALETDLTLEQIEAEYEDTITPFAQTSRNNLGGTPLHYEPSGSRTTFTFDTTFYNQLVSWRNSIEVHTPASWNRQVTQIDSYGAYVNKPGMHGQARAFDIARVTFTADNGTTRNLNCRYDQWRSWDLSKWRPRYWALSASLHLRFRHVLTYLYNRQHWNHIHVDNAVYGSKGGARFATGSTAQVQHVQACCRYLFGYSTTIDGIWGPQTRDHSTRVLRRYGVSSGAITTSGTIWRKFNFASMRQGTGLIDI